MTSIVLFVMQPEPGHTLPTISLAEQLIAHGLGVLYLTSSRVALYLRQRGFDAVAFGADQPPTSSPSAGYDIEQSGRSFWRQFGGKADRAELLRRTIDDLLHTRPIRAIVLDDLFYRKGDLYPSNSICGRPILRLLTSLPRWGEPEIPLGAARWILCPSQLELECFLGALPRTHFAEPSIDWNRPEVSLECDLAGSQKSLVLYSAGTQSMVHVDADGRLDIMLRVAAMLPDCNFIMASGRRNHVFKRDALPPNVNVVSHIPQLALMRQARLLITHGGLGSIKEAICCNVPMLALPIVFDQPYNAMRVRKKGIGRAIFPEKLSHESVRDGIVEIVENNAVSRAVSTMREQFLDAEQRRSFVQAILQNVD